MGVIEFHRVNQPIIDYRNSGKSYYTAVCELKGCGRTFYPLKSHAKFCCIQCQQKAWLKEFKQGGQVSSKRNERVEKQLKRNGGTTVIGAGNVYDSLMEDNNIFNRRKAVLLHFLKDMKHGETRSTDGFDFVRHSAQKWTWKKQ